MIKLTTENGVIEFNTVAELQEYQGVVPQEDEGVSFEDDLKLIIEELGLDAEEHGMELFDISDVDKFELFSLQDGCGECEECCEEFLPEETITLELTPEEVALIAQLTAFVAGDETAYSLGMKAEDFVDHEHMAELIEGVRHEYTESEGLVLKIV